MIFRMLDNLREKPEPVRRQIAFVLVGCVMFIIVSVWFGTLPDRFSQTAQETGEAKDATSPFFVIAEQGKGFVGDIASGIAQIKNTFSADTDDTDISKEDLSATAALSLFEEGNTESLAPDLLGDAPYFGSEFNATQTATTAR